MFFSTNNIQVSFVAGVALGIGMARTITLAAVSEQCHAESQTLNNNIYIRKAAPNAICYIDSNTQDSCTFDFRDVSLNFSRVCGNVGGQFYECDVTFDCIVSLDGKGINVDFFFANWPACMGASCSLTEIKEEYDAVLFPQFERDFADHGFTCNASEGNIVKGVIFVLFNALLMVVVS